MGTDHDHAAAGDMKKEAFARLQAGDADAARSLYAQVCRLVPEDAEAHYNLGTVLKDMGRLQEAEAAYRTVLALKPGHAETLHNLGTVLAALDRLDDAARCFEQALEVSPNAMSHHNLGSVRLRQGRLDDAVDHFRQAAALAPEQAEMHNRLGATLMRVGRHDEAAAAFQAALKINPDSIFAHNQLGALSVLREHLDDAAVHYRAVLRLAPGAAAHYNLATVLARQQRNNKAIMHYQEALRFDPNYAEAFNNLGNAFRQQGRFGEAATAYRKALGIKQDYVEAHVNLGTVLLDLGRPEEARRSYREALRLDPAHRKALIGEAGSYEKQGDPERAYRLLEPLLAADRVDADSALAFAALCRPLGRCNDAIELLEGLLERGGQTLDLHVRTLIHFSLGRLLDAADQYDRAFAHYRQGNALAGIRMRFDLRAHARYMDTLSATYNAAFVERMPRATLFSQRPVFIVGMLRSGTSLVEQILASHPSVYGAGELEEIDRIAADLPAALGGGLTYPTCVTALSVADCDRFAARYLEHLAALCPPEVTRVTDKMPGNFLHLGLIAQLFPGARIIHCVRDPLDTCLSCYFQPFAWRLAYTNDLAHLGAFYNHYRRLMDHWKAVLDLPMMEVRYEDLVLEQEKISRALVAFCGLEWDERCLRFYENRRVVPTASYDQVRQPVYTRSIGRWRHYASHLEPLMRALNGGG